MCHFFPIRKKEKHKTEEISRLLNCCQGGGDISKCQHKAFEDPWGGLPNKNR